MNNPALMPLHGAPTSSLLPACTSAPQFAAPRVVHLGAALSCGASYQPQPLMLPQQPQLYFMDESMFQQQAQFQQSQFLDYSTLQIWPPQQQPMYTANYILPTAPLPAHADLSALPFPSLFVTGERPQLPAPRDERNAKCYTATKVLRIVDPKSKEVLNQREVSDALVAASTVTPSDDSSIPPRSFSPCDGAPDSTCSDPSTQIARVNESLDRPYQETAVIGAIRLERRPRAHPTVDSTNATTTIVDDTTRDGMLEDGDSACEDNAITPVDEFSPGRAESVVRAAIASGDSRPGSATGDHENEAIETLMLDDADQDDDKDDGQEHVEELRRRVASMSVSDRGVYARDEMILIGQLVTATKICPDVHVLQELMRGRERTSSIERSSPNEKKQPACNSPATLKKSSRCDAFKPAFQPPPPPCSRLANNSGNSRMPVQQSRQQNAQDGHGGQGNRVQQRIGPSVVDSARNNNNSVKTTEQRTIERSRPPAAALHRAASAWKPTRALSASRADDANDTVDIGALCRDVRGLFNKITPEKFDELCVDFLALKIYAMSDAHINGVIGIIFDKAVEEPKYCEMYSDLCMRQVTDETQAREREQKEKNVSLFRSLILNRCQKTYEDRKDDEEKMQRLQEAAASEGDEKMRASLMQDAMELRGKCRRRMFGNIRFIGQLYRNDLVLDNIVAWCINDLLNSHNQNRETGDEESVECAVRMLETTGCKLSQRSVNPGIFLGTTRIDVNNYFRHLQTIENVSRRIRYCIIDLLEMRANQWRPRSVKESGPKTMLEVRAEFHSEKLENAIAREEMVKRASTRHAAIAQRQSCDARIPLQQWNLVEKRGNVVNASSGKSIDPGLKPKWTLSALDKTPSLGGARERRSWIDGAAGGGGNVQPPAIATGTRASDGS